MARDRLAAMRAQQGGQGGYSDPSFPQQSPNYGDGGRGYAGERDQQFSHQDPYDDPQYEMKSYSNGGSADDMTGFYSEISAIQDQIRAFNDNVTRIGELHSRSLNNMDDVAAQRNEAQLDALVEDTRALSGNLKKRIQDLERKGGSGRDGQIRKQQTGLVKSKFVEAIQSYQEVEKQYRSKYKARLERQFKIVQERHKDILKIEKTITELAQLFNDMSVLVEQQDETLNVIEAHAAQVNQDTEAGLKHTEAAVVSARAARRKRWICFFIILIILIIVGVVVGVVVANNVNKK
ncbi:Plasma membrane t-SNARE, secretory vesicle fusion [Tulasnella sp. 403]|nr:Plasma membrane t-SNARE, secretory vesicle fusion [Tulasnella sp. 403]